MAEETPKDGPDEPIAPEAQQTQETQPAVTPTEKTYSKVELDAIIKGKVAEALRKANKASQPQTQPQAADSATIARLADLESRLAFQDTLATIPDAHGLTIAQREAARKLFDPANPEGLVGTVALFLKPAEDKAVPAAPITPFVAGSAPNAPPREAPINALDWSKEDIQALKARGEFRTQLDKWRASLPGSAPVFARTMPKR